MGGPALKRLQHPFAILYNLRQFIWALIIPLARGLVLALSDGGVASWLSGAWIDLVTLLGMLLLSLLMWMAYSYEVDETGLSVRCGLIVHTSIFLPARQIATLSAVHAFYLRPFGAVRLRADTLAGSRERADLSLFVSKEEAKAILDGRVAELRSGTLSRRYRPRSLYVAALAAFSSSSFAGMIFLATLISRTGELLGAEFKSRVYGTFERVTQLLAFGIPPAAAALAYILLFGWLVAFSINFIRHKNLVVRRRGGALHIRGGVFTSREYVVAADQLNYLDIRQTVLSFFLRFCTVHINAVGYSKYSDDVSGVIPAVRVRDAARTLGLVFPEWKPAPRPLQSHRRCFVGMRSHPRRHLLPALASPLVERLCRLGRIHALLSRLLVSDDPPHRLFHLRHRPGRRSVDTPLFLRVLSAHDYPANRPDRMGLPAAEPHSGDGQKVRRAHLFLRGAQHPPPHPQSGPAGCAGDAGAGIVK